MFENCTKISTANMERPQWLEARRKGIGGSDAAAVIGMSQWATPYTVYMDKLGLLPEQEENEAMRQGRDLEEYVAQRFTEATGKKVQRCNYMIVNEAYPFALADIDRRIVGENAILECKTTSTLDLKQFRGGEFPVRYYAQCVHYLAVTGAQKCYLAVLVLGKEFHVFELGRDEEEIAALMGAEAEFWEMVKNQTPPDMTRQKPDTDAVGAIWADSCDEEADLIGMEELFRTVAAAEETEKLAKEMKGKAINEIKARMQTAERGSCTGYRCTWKTQTRRSLDLERLREDFPEIPFDVYIKISKSRPFKWYGTEN